MENIEEKMITEDETDLISHSIDEKVNSFEQKKSSDDFDLDEPNVRSSPSFGAEVHSKKQKPTVFNKFLPYQTEQDAERMYHQFISVFNKAVQIGDVNWIVKSFPGDLEFYAAMHGRYFTKEEHVRFIHVYMSLLLDKHLEIESIASLISVLTFFLRKIKLLTPDDLRIEWKPLLRLYQKLFLNNLESYGFVSIPNKLEDQFQNLIKLCRIYFAPEATAEILDEIRPMLNPLDHNINEATIFLHIFLPISRMNVDQGYGLWFDELMCFWRCHQTSPWWEGNLLKLFARLASRTIGQIDWTPHIPMIFNHFIRSLELDGNNKKITINRDHHVFDVHSASLWIVSMIGCGRSSRSNTTSTTTAIVSQPGTPMEVDQEAPSSDNYFDDDERPEDNPNEPNDVCLDYLDHLIKTLESHYHPTNNSHQNLKLYAILQKLPAYFFKRYKLERSPKKTWSAPIPREHHLSSRHVTRFVNILLPVFQVSIHRKTFSNVICASFQCLSHFRPELVLPKLIESIWSSLDTLTEPHRLMNCLHIGAFLAPVICPPNRHFPQGQQHVIPLLMAALPGIDPNDSEKMWNTAIFMYSFTNSISLVDCSSAVEMRDDLTEHEIATCLSTAQTEQFVIEFIDRVFRLIETFSNAHHQSESNFTSQQIDMQHVQKVNHDELLMLYMISAMFRSILSNCSPAIFDVALDLIFNQLRNKIFGTFDAVRFASLICRLSAQANTSKTLDKMMSHFIRLTINLIEYEDSSSTRDKLDDQIVLCMHLIADLCHSNGALLVPYRAQLELLLDKVFALKPKMATSLGSLVLHSLLKHLVTMYPTDHSNLNQSWSELLDFSKTIPTRTWGYLPELKQVKFNWHMPNEQELQMADELMQKYLFAKLDLLEQWSDGNVQLSRDEVYNALNVIRSIFTACASVLPIWNEDVKHLPKNCYIHSNSLVFERNSPVKPFPEGPEGNRRAYIAKKLLKIGSFMIQHHEDDVRSFIFLMKIYKGLILNFGASNRIIDQMWLVYQNARRMYRFAKVGASKRQPRQNLLNRVQIQHNYQLYSRFYSNYTELHEQIFKQLFRLSMSRYAEIRSTAHNHFDSVSKHYYLVHRTVLPDLLRNLNTKEEHTYTGTLDVIKLRKLIKFEEYGLLRQIWIGLLNSTHFEKESIVAAIDSLSEYLHNSYNNANFDYEMPSLPFKLINAIKPAPEAETIACKQFYSDLSRSNRDEYSALIQDLVVYLETDKAHWRFQEIAYIMLGLLIRFECDLPTNAVELLMKNINNDSLYVRKLCASAVARVLKMKPKTKKTRIVRIDQNEPFLLQPRPEVRVEPTFYLHTSHVGFYEWPKSGCKVYEKVATRSDFSIPSLELAQTEPILKCLQNDAYLDKLIKLMCIEEKKDSDKFSLKRFFLFKEIFKHFGWRAYHGCLERQLKSLILDSKNNEESHHRLAAELFAGLMRAATRYWPEDEFELLKADLIQSELVKQILKRLHKDVVSDWGTSFSKIFRNIDGRRLMFVIDDFIHVLLDDFQTRNKKTSDIQCFQLICLTEILSRQNWRSVALSRLFVSLLDGSKSLVSPSTSAHSDASIVEYNIDTIAYLTRFQNLREILGNFIGCLFRLDYEIPPNLAVRSLLTQHGTSKQKFISEFLFGKVLNCDPNCYVQSPLAVDSSESNKTHLETINNITKTVCNWIQNSFASDPNFATQQFFQFLPLFCDNQKRTETQGHDELKMQSFVSLMLFSQTFALQPDTIDFCLKICERIVGESNSWHARSAFCNFYQHWLTSNLFTLRPYEQRIIHVLDQLLRDSKIEVQECASHTLSGLVHCQFISPGNLQRMIREFCVTPLDSQSDSSGSTYRLLGLCALVNASPYTIPAYLPETLIVLSQYVNQTRSPVYSLIKKTLSSFKRTHLDNWCDHKRKFTENQLAVITDILVSPSYYA
jgi:proteasome activator subunit 4